MDSGEEGTAGYICRITGLSEQSMKQGRTIRGLFSLAPGSAEKGAQSFIFIYLTLLSV